MAAGDGLRELVAVCADVLLLLGVFLRLASRSWLRRLPVTRRPVAIR